MRSKANLGLIAQSILAAISAFPKCRRARWAFVSALLSLSQLQFARAEDSTLPPVPLATVVDQNGMNLSTGNWQQAGPTISIGPAGQGGLSYTWMFGQGIRNPFTSTVKHPYGDSSKREVSVLGNTESFTLDGSDWVSNMGGSLTVSSGNYTYTDKFGAVTYFPANSLTCAADYCTVGLASTVTFPNGEIWSFTYRTQGGVFAVASVNTNLGYQIKFNFVSDNPLDGYYTFYKEIRAINNAVEYCDPSPSVPCTNSGWPQLTIARSNSSSPPVFTYSEEVTDTAGKVWGLYGTATDHTSYTRVEDKVQQPSGQYTWHSYDRDNMGPYEFSNRRAWKGNSAEYWQYTIDGTMQVTDPNDVFREVSSDAVTGQPTSDVLDPAGINLASTWGYDADSRLTSAVSPNGDTTTLTYSSDNRGNIVQQDQKGTGKPLTTTYAYPGSCTYQKTCNKPSSVTDANGNTTDFTYSTDHGGLLTAQGPSVNGVRSLVTNTYSQKHAWYYTGTSTISDGGAVWMPTGSTTCTNANSCSGNAAERVTVLTYVTGSSGTAGNILNTEITNRAGDNSISSTTEVAYDGRGNVTSSENALGSTTVFFYDEMRRQVGVVRPNPGGGLDYPAAKTVYDDAGRVLEVQQGTTAGQTSTDFASFSTLAKAVTEYDSVTGAPIKKTAYIGSGAFGVVQSSYDPGLRITCTARRLNTSSLPSDACEQSSGFKDLISQNNYDDANRVTSITTGVGSGTTITAVTNHYSSSYPAQIDWIEDGKGNRSSFTYNGTTNRLSQLNFPDKTTPNTSSTTDYEQYSYDNQGNLTSKRLRSGETVNLTYDAMNRLSVKDLPGTSSDDVYFAYDQASELLSMRYGSTSGLGASFTWDALGRKLTESNYINTSGGAVTKTVTSAYDAAGQRTCLTYPDGSYILYSYNVLGAMTLVRQGGSTNCSSSSPTTMATYAYDNLGRVTGITRGSTNPATTGATYQANSQDWDLAQNLYSTGQDVTYEMDYNSGSQVSDRTVTSSNSGYKYSVSSGATTYNCPNGLNQYDKVGSSNNTCTSGGSAYTYDARGNLVSGGSKTFIYDIENKLIQATMPGSAGTPTNWNAANWNAFQWSGAPTTYMGYDPAGRLRQVDNANGTQQLIYDGDALLVEYDASGAILRRYVPGQGTDETLVWYEGSNLSAPNWLHTDQQGSTVAASDSTGASAAVYAYGPFGEPKNGFASGGPAFRYTGQAQIPSAELYYYKARMYDPVLGRFLQTDPAGYGAGMNLYAYVFNDPANATDPSGLGEETCSILENGVETCRSSTTRLGACPNSASNAPNNSPSNICNSYDESLLMGLAPLGSGGFWMPLVQEQPPKGPPPAWYNNKCVINAVGKGFGRAAVDLAGAIPFGNLAKSAGLARKIGNRVGYRGAVADNYGRKLVNDIDRTQSIGNAGVEMTSGELLRGAIELATIIPTPLGYVAVGFTVGLDIIDTIKAARACPP